MLRQAQLVLLLCYYRLHVSTNVQVILRPFDRRGRKCYAIKPVVPDVPLFCFISTVLAHRDVFRQIGCNVCVVNQCYCNCSDICCYSVQNLLSSSLLSKNLKIKIHRTIILPIVLYG